MAWRGRRLGHVVIVAADPQPGGRPDGQCAAGPPVYLAARLGGDHRGGGRGCTQLRRLLASCDRRLASGRRDYAIVLLLSRLGLRAGEVAGLGLDDIDWRHGEITLRGKGNRAERLPCRLTCEQQSPVSCRRPERVARGQPDTGIAAQPDTVTRCQD